LSCAGTRSHLRSLVLRHPLTLANFCSSLCRLSPLLEVELLPPFDHCRLIILRHSFLSLHCCAEMEGSTDDALHSSQPHHATITVESPETFIHNDHGVIIESSVVAVEEYEISPLGITHFGHSILPDDTEEAAINVAEVDPIHQKTTPDAIDDECIPATIANSEDVKYNSSKFEKRPCESEIEQSPILKCDEAETDHDLDALAEIVPGLFSAMKMTSRNNGEASEQAVDEELWRVGATQSAAAYSDNQGWDDLPKDANAQKVIQSKRVDDDSDSKEESLGNPNNNTCPNIQAAADSEKHEDGALSLTSSSSSTFSGHAKPSKSKRDFAEELSKDSESSQDDLENKKSSSKVVLPPSSTSIGHPELLDSKAAAELYPKKRESTSKSKSGKKVEETRHDSQWDKTPPKPPQPQAMLPMYLPYFKPATGCTNASDFIVRCFVARLRSGISVIKHGRSRWCKSVTRILHIHPDGRSLSWKPPLGEPTSSKNPPKLDLLECKEVRHAWSPDPLQPLFTGTAILRQKCEAANAHKSFALIFPKRTVDVTAITADQCKVLMEGFSALCFRLQVANMAGQMLGFSETMEHVYDRNMERKPGGSDLALSRSSGGL